MKKMRIALASMLVAAGITATAGAANFTNCADRLKDVGLFQGTNQGYQLDKAPTRAEASAMLVRLLGKEAEAEKLTYTAPFTDLKGWEKPYVQYLYDNGLCSISWLQTVWLTRPRLLLWAHFSQTRTHSTPLRRTPRRSPRWLWI